MCKYYIGQEEIPEACMRLCYFDNFATLGKPVFSLATIAASTCMHAHRYFVDFEPYRTSTEKQKTTVY